MNGILKDWFKSIGLSKFVYSLALTIPVVMSCPAYAADIDESDSVSEIMQTATRKLTGKILEKSSKDTFPLMSEKPVKMSLNFTR